MRFEDKSVDQSGRLSLGVDRNTGDYYLSIPVSNRLVDYEEYYRLSENEFQSLQKDDEAARAFAEQCRARAFDNRLILQPGTDRGTPR